MGKMPVAHHRMNFHNDEIIFPDQHADMDFGCFQENDQKPSDGICYYNEIDDDEEDENPINVAESKAFWDDQNQLLQATLTRTSSIESRIRQITKEGMILARENCVCPRPVLGGGGCSSCMRREICERLGNTGFNSAICRSKWRISPDILSGEHTYLDVIDKSDAKKGEIRVVVELNFRAEFEMARAGEDYNKLISRVPEVFVGKAKRLRTLIKILCSAAKKCRKENKMHMGPWRKQKYMQAKWLGNCERRTISSPSFVDDDKFSGDKQQHKTKACMPKASMLTFDLLENLPRLQQFTAVQVL